MSTPNKGNNNPVTAPAEKTASTKKHDELNTSAQDASTKMALETQGRPVPTNSAGIGELALQQLGQRQQGQRPPAQRGENGVTPAKAAFDRRQAERAAQQQQTDNLMNQQRDAAIGSNNFGRLPSDTKQLFLLQKQLTPEQRAKVFGAMNEWKKPYYTTRNMLPNWKESQLAEIGRKCQESIALHLSGKEQKAEEELGKVKGLITWRGPNPLPEPVRDPNNGSLDKTQYWSTVETIRRTIAAAIDPQGNIIVQDNNGNAYINPGHRYFQQLRGAFQADSATADPINTNINRDNLLRVLERGVPPGHIMSHPVMWEARALNKEQFLVNADRYFGGESQSAIAAHNLCQAMQKQMKGDIAGARELIEKTTAAGQPYAQWTSSIISNNNINEGELNSKVNSFYHALWSPNIGQQSDEVRDRYISTDLLRSTEKVLNQQATITETLFCTGVRNYMNSAQFENSPLEQRKAILSRPIRAAGVVDEIELNKLLSGLK